MTEADRRQPTTLHGVDLSKARIVTDPEEIRKILEYEEPAPEPDQPPLPTPPNAGEKTATPELPTEFMVGGRTYKLVSFLTEGEDEITGDTMVARARELGANGGEEDGRYILEHQDEIPESLRGKSLTFPEWRGPGGTQYVACLYWSGDGWGGTRAGAGSTVSGAATLGWCAVARRVCVPSPDLTK